MNLDDLKPSREPLEWGTLVLTELVAAVEFLGRGPRPRFTVWDALEEALRGHADIDPDWQLTDPLRDVLYTSFIDESQGSAAEVIQRALRRWLEATARMFNDGQPFATP